jgi:mycothiol synthase
VESRGYLPRWDSWVLKMALDGWDAPPPTVPGVTVRALRRPDEDREIHDVVETAFATWPDRNLAMTFEDWRVSYLDRADDVDLVLVAEKDGRIVGAAVCAPEDDEGWVDQLAVLPDHWGRGIGGALLQASFRAFRDRGLAVAALSTDSRTGALGLYEHVGMTVVESYTRYTLRL